MALVGRMTVEGDDAIVAAFDEVSDGLEAEVARAVRVEWATSVASTIAGRLPVRTGAWRGQVAAYSTPKGADIVWGHEQWRAWLEFGGRRPRDRRARPRRPAGRWAWPTALAAEPRLTDVAERAVDRLSRKAGLG